MSSFAPVLAARAATADEGAIIRMSQKSRDLKAQGRDVVNLTVGEPDFDTPANIQLAAAAAMAEGFTHYSPVAGIPELRAALAAKLAAENALPYPASGIVLANGAKQAIVNAVLSLVEAGDEVIMLAPFWLSYEIVVRFAGGTPVVLKASVGEDYKVPASLIAAVTPRTRLIVVNSPCNPTGAVWSPAELEAIASIVRAHPRLMVLSDEIYEYILFDGEMRSIGSLPGMLERTVTINGFSKGFAMTGWRLGYAATASSALAQAMARMQSTISAGANAFVQRAALAALEGPRDAVEAMRLRYRARRDMVMGGLKSIAGVRIAPIAGTFYAFPDVSALLGGKSGNHVFDTVERLCDWLLDEHGVATVPGTAFGAPGSLRISFAAGEAEIESALARMAGALNSLDLSPAAV